MVIQNIFHASLYRLIQNINDVKFSTKYTKNIIFDGITKKIENSQTSIINGNAFLMFKILSNDYFKSVQQNSIQNTLQLYFVQAQLYMHLVELQIACLLVQMKMKLIFTRINFA